MTGGGQAFPEADNLPEYFPDVAWKWTVPLKSGDDFAAWEFRKEPFASDAELKLKLAVMGLRLGEEVVGLRGVYCKAYRVLYEGA